MSKIPGLTAQETIQKHPLQAIILADAWGEETRWGPLVRRDRSDDSDSENGEEAESEREERPWCLLPLINIPLLAWTLECLAASGVQEAFIFIREGSEQVRTFLSTSPFTLPTSTLLVTLRPTQAATPGDVLREVDSLGILAPTDFLVVQAGYVGNVNLEEKVREFTERRGREPSLSMSCLVAPRKTPTSSTFAVHVLSPDAQLYHYEESSFFPKLKQAKLPRDAFGPKDITVRADLESIGVAICNVEVPALFTENFDYQYFYPDFVNGILTSDLLGKTICCSIIDQESVVSEKKVGGGRQSANWAATVGNTKSFDAISHAILSRKAYPMAPDENLPEGSERYEQRRARVYYGTDLNLSRTCEIGSATLLGHHTIVNSLSSITHSIISPYVIIGSNCSISGSHIFEGAIIGNNCKIIDSIIGEQSRIGEGSWIEGGSLVGGRTILGTGSRLMGGRVSSEEVKGDLGEEGKRGSLGEGHSAFFWPSDSARMTTDDTDDEDDALDPRNLSMSRIGAQFSSLQLSDSSSSISTLSRSSSTTSLSSDDLNSEDDDSDGEPPAIAGIASLSAPATESDFLSECKQSLDRAFVEDHTVENAVIEMKTLRMASNKPLALVRDFVIPYVLGKCQTSNQVGGIITRWGGLVSSLTGTEESEMVAGLFCAQKYVVEQREGDLKFFGRVLKGFYEEDVVTEEAVFSWYSNKLAREGEVRKKMWDSAKPFVAALMEEDSDESD